MARKAFYSFHYKPDAWRASQVRSIGVIEGNQVISDNDWEEVTNGGDAAIKRWIDGQMSGRSCVIVLIGSATANRKWINYEIIEGWNAGKGVVGIYIHNLKNVAGSQTLKGGNPFRAISIGNGSNAKNLSSIAKAYDPPFSTSTYVYDHIKNNIESWVTEAIQIRANN